ncbi:MAG TPA: HAD-IA family hydrolase [Tissierellia bacterium]|nr:HAD-IA family hydrolase [Tissierellia bacterium]
MIKVVLFDLDDTLYNEREFVYCGFKEVSKYLSDKYQVSCESLYSCILNIFKIKGRGKIFNFLCEKYDFKEDIDELVRIYRYNEGEINLYKDANYVLENFKGKYKLGLITDGYKGTQWNKIKSLDIEKYMDKVIVTDDYGKDYWKPSIKPFQIMLEDFNIKPKECVYVGDNPNKDFIPCKKLGINSVRIIRPIGDHMNTFLDKDYEADFNIKSLLELENIFKSFS